MIQGIMSGERCDFHIKIGGLQSVLFYGFQQPFYFKCLMFLRRGLWSLGCFLTTLQFLGTYISLIESLASEMTVQYSIGQVFFPKFEFQ